MFSQGTRPMSEDHISSDFGYEEEEHRDQGAVKDDLCDEDPVGRKSRENRNDVAEAAHHRHGLCCTTRLPKTGPMLSPASRHQI